jgi:hypothetical protein
VLDINGQELREGAAASLLCEIVAIEPEGIRVRVMNSDMELLVGTHHDEVLGGLVADSELTAQPREYRNCWEDEAGNVYVRDYEEEKKQNLFKCWKVVHKAEARGPQLIAPNG